MNSIRQHFSSYVPAALEYSKTDSGLNLTEEERHNNHGNGNSFGFNEMAAAAAVNGGGNGSVMRPESAASTGHQHYH